MEYCVKVTESWTTVANQLQITAPSWYGGKNNLLFLYNGLGEMRGRFNYNALNKSCVPEGKFYEQHNSWENLIGSVGHPISKVSARSLQPWKTPLELPCCRGLGMQGSYVLWMIFPQQPLEQKTIKTWHSKYQSPQTKINAMSHGTLCWAICGTRRLAVIVRQR